MDLKELYPGEDPDFLREVCRAPELLRLRDVGMNCGCEYTSFPLYRIREPYSRFDHSLGCARMIWHFTRDVRQTLAALLHDVATPVFAHTIDFLNGDYERQESTEDGTREMIEKSEVIGNFLKKAKIPVEDVCDYHRYPLADNPSPRLCADRLEYTLGNLYNYRFCEKKDLAVYFRDVTVADNEVGEPELCFGTREAGVDFALKAVDCAAIYVAPEDRYSMKLLSELVGRALRRGVILPEDLYSTEGRVIGKFLEDPETRREWLDFRKYGRMTDPKTADPESLRVVTAKKRIIDPMVAGEGRISEISPLFREKADKLRQADFTVPLAGLRLDGD